MTGGNSSPFGTPQSSPYRGGSQPAQHPAPAGGPVAPAGPTNRRLEVSIFRAPWPLLGAALTAIITGVFLVFYVTDRRLNAPQFENFEFLLLAFGVLAPIIGAILCLRTYPAGRIVLTVWAVLSLILLLHSTLWPVPIIAAMGAVLAWLPASRRWTDY